MAEPSRLFDPAQTSAGPPQPPATMSFQVKLMRSESIGGHAHKHATFSGENKVALQMLPEKPKMSRFTDEQKMKILREARTNLARPKSTYTQGHAAEILGNARATLRRLDVQYPSSKVGRAAPLAAERRDRGVVYKTRLNRRPPRVRESEPTFTLPNAADREYWIEFLKHLVEGLRRETADELTLAVRPLAVDVATLRAELAEQRLERGEIIDLPPVPLRPRELN